MLGNVLCIRKCKSALGYGGVGGLGPGGILPGTGKLVFLLFYALGKITWSCCADTVSSNVFQASGFQVGLQWASNQEKVPEIFIYIYH